MCCNLVILFIFITVIIKWFTFLLQNWTLKTVDFIKIHQWSSVVSVIFLRLTVTNKSDFIANYCSKTRIQEACLVSCIETQYATSYESVMLSVVKSIVKIPERNG